MCQLNIAAESPECLTKHRILFSIVVSAVDADQSAKIKLIDLLLVFVDPVAPLLFGLGRLEMVVVQMLDINLGKLLFKVLVDLIIDAVYAYHDYGRVSLRPA